MADTQPSLKIVEIPLAELHADMGNARRHDDRNLRAIEDSLRQFGQLEPLVVQQATGKVIGGNGRLEVMRRLGWSHCQVVRVDYNDAKAAAAGIALNRTGELAQWDAKALEAVLSSLESEFELTDLGFDQDELDRILQPGLDLGQPDELAADAPRGDDLLAEQDTAANDDGRPADDRPATPPPANVRMVQLFYQPDTAEEFYTLADAAQKELGAPHLSETILQVLRQRVPAPA